MIIYVCVIYSRARSWVSSARPGPWGSSSQKPYGTEPPSQRSLRPSTPYVLVSGDPQILRLETDLGAGAIPHLTRSMARALTSASDGRGGRHPTAASAYSHGIYTKTIQQVTNNL